MYPVTAAANMTTIAIARTKTRRCIVCHLRSSFLIVEANCWIPVQDFSLEIGWNCGFIVRAKGLPGVVSLYFETHRFFFVLAEKLPCDDDCSVHPRMVRADVVVCAVHREGYRVSCVWIHVA